MVKTTLQINGMACGMCESHVNEAIRNAFKVKKVNSSHAKNETVIISEEELPEDQIRKVIEPTGYELVSVSSEAYVKKGSVSQIKVLTSQTMYGNLTNR